MARSPKLKVYRTPIGFHDAYVAASSQKAALAAWGSDHDLFARGIAEIVTEAALTAAPLATPGVVVKRSRGTTAEQIAALPKDERRPAPRTVAPEKPKPKPRRPSRSELDAAEARLLEVKHVHDAARAALREREQALARERRAFEKTEAKAMERAQREQDAAAQAYRAAMAAWEG